MARKNSAKEAALGIFLKSLQAASPETAVKKSVKRIKGSLIISGEKIRLEDYKRVFVVGAGKAAPSMARAMEGLLGDRITEGLAVTKYGHAQELERIKTIEAGHPFPDENGFYGAKEFLKIAEGAKKDDLVIFLLSGGASALLPLPPEGISLKDKQKAIKLLVNSGASINEINAIRKHISLIKGGWFSKAAWPARVITLIISDVVGDDISSIGSGPCAPDPFYYSDCLNILEKYGLMKKMPLSIINRLKKGKEGLLPETPKPADKIFRNSKNLIIANNLLALKAGEKEARRLGFDSMVLTSRLAAETRESARFFTSVLKEISRQGTPVKPPACVLMGGETVIKVAGKGKGGRNQDFCLSAALELAGTKGITVLSAGTDGTDGPTDAAGAIADSNTIKYSIKAGLDAKTYLLNNDSYNFFRKAGGLVITGPTGTNVMDIIIGIVA